MIHIGLLSLYITVNQQILAAIKFGVSQNKVIYVNLAAIKFGVSPRPVYAVYDRRICWRRQILAKTRNSPNSPNIIARQNLLIYSIQDPDTMPNNGPLADTYMKRALIIQILGMSNSQRSIGGIKQVLYIWVTEIGYLSWFAE